VFSELVQREVRVDRLAAALGDALDRRPALLSACARVEATLGTERTPSLAVAQMLAPWLAIDAGAGAA
jgi:hypothetical protein